MVHKMYSAAHCTELIFAMSVNYNRKELIILRPIVFLLHILTRNVLVKHFLFRNMHEVYTKDHAKIAIYFHVTVMK